MNHAACLFDIIQSMVRIKILLILALIANVFLFPQTIFAQVGDNGSFEKASIFFSPRVGSFVEGSTFEVLVIIDTQGESINTVELNLRFDPEKIEIVKPSGDKSIIGVWIDPPSYVNALGTMKLVGVIPNGVNTESGLITSITFKAVAPGDTRVTIDPSSRVLANDGSGSTVDVTFDTGFYTVLPGAPEGPRVFSETHPLSSRWYNNKNPILLWEKDPGVTSFSYELDDKPFTIPDNTSDTEETRFGFENAKDGLNYFHIKALKGNIWGGTTHYLIKIDTIPPVEFKPTYELIPTAVILSRAFISFITTDSLSGIDHYEVSGINKSEDPNISPVYVRAESPYQLPTKLSDNTRVIVRAFDKAGNVRDESMDVEVTSILGFIKNNIGLTGVSTLLLIILFGLMIHYLFGHRVLAIMRRAFKTAQKEEKLQEKQFKEIVSDKDYTKDNIPPET